jgi:cholesterol oxidase
MTGCRHNAKNTLVKNYLHLAEKNGAVVHPLTTVTRVRPLEGGGYRVEARWTKAKLSRRSATKTFTAGQVVFAAAALGTQKLLHRLKATGDLPGISDGSAISANLGVNPSLTITAQAERAMAYWPNKGEPDPRPAPGEGYRSIPPVRPAHPVVPEEAPAALRLPIVAVS